jgi:NADH dehydrogenase FAD-containing subunit
LSGPRVVILGAGFGGLTAAKALAEDADITVVDRHNFQTFLPLLYQVSTAGLAAARVFIQDLYKNATNAQFFCNCSYAIRIRKSFAAKSFH